MYILRTLREVCVPVLSLEDKIHRRADVIARAVPQGAVLVDMVSGRCFELNAVGARCWFSIETPNSLRRIAETVGRDFKVSPEVLQRDILALSDELLSAGLVSIVTGQGP